MSDRISICGGEYPRAEIDDELIGSCLAPFQHGREGSEVFAGQRLLAELVDGCMQAGWREELHLVGLMASDLFLKCLDLPTPVFLKDLGFPYLAVALGKIATTEAIDALKEGILLGGDDPDYLFVREASGTALAKIGGEEISEYLRKVSEGPYAESPRRVAQWSLTRMASR